ncbi:large-conductance mechanosensitive channel protein MscL [Roseibacillus ishigakijimensis]|uniref:Large-conductance mechanosensitive channel n=1 Tax=Roseibacillus ishigakijimensis TaxID=454146 RepID=A0A934RRH6_9BACT|nr:large-conductance mechanosensitive channel protein MscL [Roseibacillus ishigakijimensis]MBK1833694.1 large-conductance mechanosensitive channel protein MscL [Roseibacillus ishigakijimensis]
MLKEFKEFAFKGNLVDMAVGFILGGAFSTVVKSLVDNVIMPPIGFLLGKVQFADLSWNMPVPDGDPVKISYGQFLQDFVSFTILAFVVFIVVKKVIASFEKAKEEETVEPPAQEKLLAEIRDLLKKDVAN